MSQQNKRVANDVAIACCYTAAIITERKKNNGD